ncbi:hypothetical protein M406DRAFT_320516 [Cryphonectria parasitica EP155]|uniref:Uncharacterized protein n=1 Tax=Cryphonectria parasitica (strain ATCC 38755 / EP155) TaxID=660469 RepID=A0A9P5CUN5_CRYP1|nr:uncharacterized protein M406DRAFT_320516 [Cryphonectria parasitica EP155]KAF3770807.1 hypothetical protein M406DRAFT_320516 [Cryphonectria parasitica EP155]
MSSSQDSFSISHSPPPPSDLGSYMRSMHQHTKRQIEAMSRSQERRSRNTGSRGTPSMPNGVGHSSSSNTDEYLHS